MKNIKWTLDVGFGNACLHQGEIEINDETSEDEIEKMVKDEVYSCLDWWWEEA